MLISEHDRLFHQAHDSLDISTLYRGEHLTYFCYRHYRPRNPGRADVSARDFVLKMLKSDNDMKIIAKTIDNFHFIGYYYLVNNDKCQL